MSIFLGVTTHESSEAFVVLLWGSDGAINDGGAGTCGRVLCVGWHEGLEASKSIGTP